MERWVEAFRVARRIERRGRLLLGRGHQDYRVGERVAVSSNAEVRRLPTAMNTWLPQDGLGPAVRFHSRADVVMLGRFDVDATVRFRAFYVHARRPSTVAVQRHSTDGKPGLGREIRARKLVARHRPDLAPPLHGFGRLRSAGVAYLREGILHGRHPKGRAEVQRLAVPVATGLRHLHAAVGVERRRLSEVAPPYLLDGWRTFAQDAQLSPSLAESVEALVRRDGLLEVSLGHGDLVGSNLIVPDGGNGRVVLIDWEYARSLPIVFDLAKFHVSAEDRAAVVDGLKRVLGSTIRGTRDSYSLEEQLVLAQAQMLAWHEHRAKKAARAGRMAALERDTRRRVAALTELVGG